MEIKQEKPFWNIGRDLMEISFIEILNQKWWWYCLGLVQNCKLCFYNYEYITNSFVCKGLCCNHFIVNVILFT